MWIGPPKALDWPKPMSSISTISTFGRPVGAFTSNRGGAFALRASSVVIGVSFGSGIGSTVRSSVSGAAFSSDFCWSAISRSVWRVLNAAIPPSNAPRASTATVQIVVRFMFFAPREDVREERATDPGP